MSTVDLMLLGVLMQKQINAYEIKKEMESRNIQKWIKVSSPAIYKNIIKLNKLGYIDGKVIREGEMPEKTIYSINDKGRAYFIKLMEYYSEGCGKIYIDFCAFISNLQNVDYKTGLKMIDQLQKGLSYECDGVNDALKRLNSIDKNLFYGISILNLYAQIYNILYAWINEFKKQYIENSKQK